jgi:TolB-like protein/Tfp pilus assembly protein PilF
LSLFNELKRRNVIRVGIAYVVVSWLVMQFADVVLDNIDAPGWVFQVIMLVLAIGLPLALVFAWAFEMTPEGIKKEKDVDRSQSIVNKTGRKLDFTIIAVMAIALGYFIWESRFQNDSVVIPANSSVIPAKAGTSMATAEPSIADTSANAAPKTNSIAVLPFANRSQSQDDLYFTDGIHDDLLTQLAKIKDLRVTSRTSVMEYRDTTKKIPEIAKELGVSTILEGGIQRAGKRIRINAQLIDVATDEHLWAETFDREMTVENIFEIQSEITRQIVKAVRGELSTEETEVLSQLPTRSLEAYEAYLHAKNSILHPDYNRQKFEDAERWAEMAVELDPEFALAWAMLVETNAQAIWKRYDDTPERLQRVRDSLSKATEFGPFLPETLAARAEYLYRIENNFPEAEIAFLAASTARPGDASLVKRLAYTQRRTGKWQQAVSNMQLAFELDPEDVNARSEMITTLFQLREYDRAEPLINSWIEKYPDAMDLKGYKWWLMVVRDGDLVAARNLFNQIEPNGGIPYITGSNYLPFLERDYQKVITVRDSPQYAALFDDRNSKAFDLQNKSVAYDLMGDSKKANEYAQMTIAAYLQIQSDSSGSDSSEADILLSLAFTYSQMGQFAKALEAINQACALIPESRDSFAGTDYTQARAQILAMSGQRDEALLEIERLLSIPAGMDRWILYLDPTWDFFRDDERFNALIRPDNLPETET